MPCFLYGAIIFPAQSLYPFFIIIALSHPLSYSVSLYSLSHSFSLIEHVDSQCNRLLPSFRVTQLIVFNLLL